MLWQKGIKESCQDFLAFHLESARKIEFVRLNDLLNEIIFQNKIDHLKVEEQDVEDESMNDSDESFDGSISKMKVQTSLKMRSSLKEEFKVDDKDVPLYVNSKKIEIEADINMTDEM